MIGNNKLQLNSAQMNEAVEYYLKNVMLKDDKFQVTDVSENKSSGYFEIRLEGPAYAEERN
jgi:hypothetical protein